MLLVTEAKLLDFSVTNVPAIYLFPFVRTNLKMHNYFDIVCAVKLKSYTLRCPHLLNFDFSKNS